jgi:hypothetical protein
MALTAENAPLGHIVETIALRSLLDPASRGSQNARCWHRPGTAG